MSNITSIFYRRISQMNMRGEGLPNTSNWRIFRNTSHTTYPKWNSPTSATPTLLLSSGIFHPSEWCPSLTQRAGCYPSAHLPCPTDHQVCQLGLQGTPQVCPPLCLSTVFRAPGCQRLRPGSLEQPLHGLHASPSAFRSAKYSDGTF